MLEQTPGSPGQVPRPESGFSFPKLPFPPDPLPPHPPCTYSQPPVLIPDKGYKQKQKKRERYEMGEKSAGPEKREGRGTEMEIQRGRK